MGYQGRMEARLDRLARYYARQHRARGHTPEASRTEAVRQVVCAACGYGIRLVPCAEAIYVERIERGEYVCPGEGR